MTAANERYKLNKELAQMLKGGVIMDVTTPEQAVEVARKMAQNQFAVKAQVHAGGRGKGTFKNGFKGGVHVVKSAEEVGEVAGKMLNQVLVTKQTGEVGKLVQTVMVAEAVDLKKECYFAILQDRARKCPVIVASQQGGMDIEEVAKNSPEAILKVYIDGGLEEGYHEITTGYKYSSSYMPPKLQQDIDIEEVNPFLEMMFGQLHSTKKMLLVW